MPESGDRHALRTRLGIDLPIVQGPFGGGYSSARLAAAVSNAGGLGSFGVHALSAEQILHTATAIRALTAKPYALNLWVSNRDFQGDQPPLPMMQRMHERLKPYYRELGLEHPPEPVCKPVYDFEEQAQAVIEARPAVFSFVFGVPSPEIVKACKQRGIVTLGAATTLAEALALEQGGVDMIVASGFEAGGHRPSFLEPAEASLHGTLALVPQAASAVRVPVIAAGGIADARGVAAALHLGAQAVQVGTAFLACEESGAPELHKKLLFEPAAARTVLTRAFTGRLARGIRNRLHDELTGFAEVLPYPAQGWALGALRDAALAQGNAGLVPLWCGQSARLLRHRRAAELLPALVSAL